MTSAAIVPAGDVSALRVPEERVVQMIAACAEEIRRARTIEDAKRVSSVAEAIAAVSRKVEAAKEVKEAAIRLLVDAEIRLGEILRALPKQSGGRPGTKRKPGKVSIAREHGIDKRRSSFAQRLAVTPREEVERVIEGGAKTLHAVTVGLKFHTSGYDLRERKAALIAFLCEEALALLERSVARKEVPHAGTVAEMLRRVKTIREHGNTKG